MTPVPANILDRGPQRLKTLQFGLSTFLKNRGYGDNAVPATGNADKVTRHAVIEAKKLLGYHRENWNSYADDVFANYLVHPAWRLRRDAPYSFRPGYVTRGAAYLARVKAARAAARVPIGKTRLFDGVVVATPAYQALTAGRKSGRWHGTIPDKTYGGRRTYAQQAVLRKEYEDSGWDPRFIAASPDLPSKHQLLPPKGYAVDIDDHVGYRSYADHSGDRRLVPYGGWANDGEGDYVHWSNDGG